MAHADDMYVPSSDSYCGKRNMLKPVKRAPTIIAATIAVPSRRRGEKTLLILPLRVVTFLFIFILLCLSYYYTCVSYLKRPGVGRPSGQPAGAPRAGGGRPCARSSPSYSSRGTRGRSRAARRGSAGSGRA